MSSDKTENLLSITEVSALLQVPQHVLRVWEGQFQAITPIRARNGRRYYSPETVDVIRKVQDLSINQGLDAAEVRAQLAQQPNLSAPLEAPQLHTPQEASTGNANLAMENAQLRQVMSLLQQASEALSR